MIKKKRIKDRDLLNTYHKMKCTVTGCRNMSDPCHIKSRGSGGDDVPWNLINLCRAHHSEHGSIGFVKFMRKYPSVMRKMDELGWGIVNEFGVERIRKVR